MRTLHVSLSPSAILYFRNGSLQSPFVCVRPPHLGSRHTTAPTPGDCPPLPQPGSVSLPCSQSSDLPVGHTPPQRGPWNSTHVLRSEGHRELDVTLFLSRPHTSAGAVSFFLAASSRCGFRRSLNGLRPPGFSPRIHVAPTWPLCGLGVFKLKRNISQGKKNKGPPLSYYRNPNMTKRNGAYCTRHPS